MDEPIALLPRHRAKIVQILTEHFPGVEVWAYGSRVNGRSHAGNDLDLTLRSPGLRPLDPASLRRAREAFRDSTIPFFVEARDWARLPAPFHAEIERCYAVLIAGGGPGCDRRGN